jgi:hypothetical protein
MESDTFTYSALSNAFGPSAETGAFAMGAVSRDGSLVGLSRFNDSANLRTAPDLTFVHLFNGIDGGIAFNGSSDIFYGVNTTSSQIIAYSTVSFAERFRLNIGETMPFITPFGTGLLVASNDGHLLALETPAGIRIFPVEPTPAPSVTPGPTPSPTGTPTPVPQLLNISTRMRIDTGNNVLIGGFIVTGLVSKNVAVRGIGPSLGSAVSDALADPTLELRGSNGAVIIADDDWQSDPIQAALLTNLNLPLSNPKESGLVTTLKPGSYTAILAGTNETAGVGLLEMYDVNQGANSQLANISTRGLVQTGANVMIGGFILGGTGNAQMAIRGIGPSLGQSGVTNFLPDPTLELRDSNGAVLVANDNWQDDSAAAAQLIAHHLGLQNPAESGIFTSLEPGAFTAVLAGKNGGVGVGLVEIYNIQ